MSKKKVEEELKESGKNATRVVMFDDMVVEGKDKVFTNIKKLKCDYTTYKEERTKHNMPVEEVCSKCGKSFEAGEEIYTADIGTEPLLKQVIICRNCAKGEE